MSNLDLLHERLVLKAHDDGLLEIAYRIVDSPVGPLLLAATNQGLLRVAFERENHDSVLEILSAKVSPRILHSPSQLDSAAQEIDEYFAGRRTYFDLSLDLQLSTGFRRTVLGHLPEISFGDTASYADVAALAGSPKAVRAVGTACATNPLPIVLPCHRVVRSDGTPGAYVGGADTKLDLLNRESVNLL